MSNKYSLELKAQTLSTAKQRGSRTLESVATEMGVSLGAVKGWLKQAARVESGLSGEALHAWCREKGLFEHRLKQWYDAFCGVGAPANVPAVEHRQTHAALRELQGRHDQLQRELRRKDKALDGAAAVQAAAPSRTNESRRLERTPQKRSKPRALVATRPDQIYSWDITYLPSSVRGTYFYPYLFFDIFSRKGRGLAGVRLRERRTGCATARRHLFAPRNSAGPGDRAPRQR